ncbi:hypothetical protein MQE23_00035 [Streptomyces sp. HP-A2021]|uniref:hypothetical protein n=1 Tax=Streptomyces sp. HP-A2021 TaxID=2927875 RepID=UPI001FAFF679|nr:hypothetical protein [Streptomyces sp. HP-A2021]UOB07601.1 hypothetical protein MQE23_00035 [Streptomyces sp. HP-A2021]
MNNESADIIRMLNSRFAILTGNHLDFYPSELRGGSTVGTKPCTTTSTTACIRRIRQNAGTLQRRCHHALRAVLDDWTIWAQPSLYHRRHADRADWRLFVTLVRFDVAYTTRIQM